MFFFGNVQYQTESGQATFLVPGEAGILGAGYALAASMPTNGGTVLDTLAAANSFPNIFSLCVNQNNPFMSFGQDYYGSSGFLWTDVTPPYYTIVLTDFLLASGGSTTGNTIGLSQTQLNQNGIIVDSGTTLISLDSQTFTAFYNQLVNLCSSGSNLVGVCGVSLANSIFHAAYPLSSSDISAYPTLQFQVACSTGSCSTLNVPPQVWLIAYTSTTTTAGISSGTGTILGDVFMMNFHVVFDKTRNQLGFASQSTCNLNGKAAGEILHSAFMDTINLAVILVRSWFT